MSDAHVEQGETNTDGTEPVVAGTEKPSGATSTADFKPISSQRELEQALKERLDRERAKFKDYGDLKSKAAKFDELVEAQKTEAQKQVEAQQAIIARAEAAERDLAQLREAKELDDYKSQVADKTGVPAKALRGGTREEIDEHAATLKALLPEPRKPGQVPAEGRTVSPGTGDPAAQFTQILQDATRRSGR